MYFANARSKVIHIAGCGYERAMYQAKERKRRTEINRVLKLIDSLAMA